MAVGNDLTSLAGVLVSSSIGSATKALSFWEAAALLEHV
jgi:hypothetical protein